MSQNTVGERIRERRLQLGLTQEQLAERLGYADRTSVNKIEKSGRGFPQHKISRFADALDTTEVYLLGMVDDPDWRMPAKETDAVFELRDGEQIFVEKYRTADPEKKRLVAYVLGIEK